MADWKKLAMAVGTSSQYIKGDGTLGNTSSIGGTDSTKLPLTGGTLTGDLIVEDSEVHVGDKSGDSWTRIKHNGADGYGFDWQHNNSTVLVNEQGSTNQALVLGDVDANNTYSGLFGIAHSGNAGSSWTKKLDLRGNGDLYIGSSGTSKVATESYVTSQGYLTSHQDISGKANLSGASFTGHVAIGSSTPFLYVGDGTENNDSSWDANIMLDSNAHSRIRIENRSNNRNLEIYSHSGTAEPHVRATDSATKLYVGVAGSESYWDDNGRITTNGDGTSGNWKTAYDWGDHSSAGYLTSVPNHSASLITSGTLPVARGGTGQTSGYNKSNWDTAYGWGNHASAGYVTTDTNTNQLTTWNLNGGNITTIGHNETVTFSGSGATSVSQSGNTITISSTDNNTIYALPLASSSTRGGVKIGYSENGKNYPVELSSEKMYVNVPWINTTYQAGTGMGLGSGYFYIADSGVTTAKINNSAVTTAKINDDAVTNAKIASNSISSAQINGTNTPASGQFLQYAPTGTGLHWATPTDTNTTYSAGTGISISGSNVISLQTQYATENYVDDEIDNLSDDIPTSAELKAQYGILASAPTTTSSGSKTLSTSYQAVSTTYYKVQFKAPSTGKVFIQAQVHQDASSSGRYFYYEFATSTPSTTYSARHRIDETDDVNQTIGMVVTGLTSGSTYTYYLYARLNATYGYLRWGSSYGKPYMIVTAINA